MSYPYKPCRNGIHVCGTDEINNEFVTVANVPGYAYLRFDELRAMFALPDGEDPDLVVDCMVDGDIVDDFGIRRQSLLDLVSTCQQYAAMAHQQLQMTS